MKIAIILLYLSLVILLNFDICIAQNQSPSAKETPDEGVKHFDVKNYKDWQKIDLPTFYFYVPQNVKENKEIRCYETCYEFVGDKFVIRIDNSGVGFRPKSPERSLKSYKDKIFKIGSALAWFWSFETENRGYKYHTGVLFHLPENINDRLQISINSDKSNIDELAEKIIISIHFKEVVQNNK